MTLLRTNEHTSQGCIFEHVSSRLHRWESLRAMEWKLSAQQIIPDQIMDN
jgi:hypothetical protein